MKTPKALFTALCLLCGHQTLSLPALAADPLKLPATKDNSIVLYEGEFKVNAGRDSRIRLKGNQHLIAMDFDTAPIRGKRIKAAWLVARQGDQTLTGVSLSTIQAPWDENRSNAITGGVGQVNGWGYEGAMFPALAGGNAHSLITHIRTGPAGGQYRWPLPPDMVHALAIGAAHGIALHEHEADYSRNPTIFAREQSASRPYLEVELQDDPANPGPPAIPPAAPTNLKITGADLEELRLHLTAPAAGLAYEVLIDGAPLPRHNIPFVAPGKTQSIALRDLPLKPGAKIELSIFTLGSTGLKSPPARLSATLPAAPDLPAPLAEDWPRAAAADDNLAVIPQLDKYDLAGKPVGDLPPDHRKHNALFDGRVVRLTAARGEVTGFQVLLRGDKPVKLNLTFPGPALRVDLWRGLYVQSGARRIPDPLMPLAAADEIALSPDQDAMALADVYISFDAAPGLRQGTLELSDGRRVPVELTIHPATLPKKAGFLCEMNSYGLPDDVKEFYALQRIAYDHRVHCNILYYPHTTAAPGARKTSFDMRLADGKRIDNRRFDAIKPGDRSAYWDDFVKAFDPYLTGDCFKDGHRGPIPAPGFYLPFHESWPLNCRAHFNGDLDAYEAFAASPQYAATYVGVLKDFAALARKRGWQETGFQVYFNNKGSLKELTKAPWILDEPTSFWDYRALRYYGQLTDQGRAQAQDLKIDYRIDISRPEFDRAQLDRPGDFWVVSSWAFEHYRRLVADRMATAGLKTWIYGSSNDPKDSNRMLQAWALDAWRFGATGLVPWQTVDKSGAALKKADPLGLFIFDKQPDGAIAIRHSLRLKAYRQAEQDIELLILLKNKRNWTGGQMRRWIAQYVSLDGRTKKVDEADAGVVAYDRLSPAGLDRLRRDTLRLLAQ